MKITRIHAQEILDSRDMPTVECVITLDGMHQIHASVPSGASVGQHEAKELRDGDMARYQGKGVLQAVRNVELLGAMFIGKQPDVVMMDGMMIDADKTADRSRYGANAILALSIAIVRAQAFMHNIPLYRMIAKLSGTARPSIPLCMFNVINGGKHANNQLALQEFMIMPNAPSIKQNLEVASSVYHALKQRIQARNASTGLGDEGGFALVCDQSGKTPELQALDILKEVAEEQRQSDISLSYCIDAAASTFYNAIDQTYDLHGQKLSSHQMIAWYQQLIDDYAITSLEDGLDENDWVGWHQLTQQLGKRVQLVGDDLFVTHIDRIKQGIDRQCATAVLIKPNQIGTVTQTLQAIALCKRAGYNTIISHRSGETNDTFIADVAVGTDAGQLKAGAPARGERVAKYNRLLEIEEELNQ